MTTSIIYNETDFEENIYDFFTFLMYKGAPFTGTLIQDKWTIEFKNGNANGRSTDYYDNGQIASDCIYVDGNYKEGKEWYANGQLKSEQSTSGNFLWDTDGTLAFRNGEWLYKSGKVKQRKIEGGCEYYSKKGELAIIIQYVNQGDFKNKVRYHDDVLFYCHQDLLVNLYPALDSLFYNTEWYFWGWIWKLLSKDRQRTLDILNALKNHTNVVVSKKASELLLEIYLPDAENVWKNYGYNIID